MGYNVLKELWAFRKSVIFWFIPIAACPLPIYFSVADRDFYKQAACAFVVIIMAFYWMFEAVPLAVTGLIPLILFPVLGIQPSSDVSKNYLKDTNVLFLGGLMVAVAIEHVNLHKRVALRVLLLVGSQPRWVMLGFMIATAFLSMWISNTATTAMMTPIGAAVLAELYKEEEGQTDGDPTQHVQGEDNEAVELEAIDEEGKPPVHDAVADNTDSEQETGKQKQPEINNKASSRRQSMQKGLMLCIAYAANIGGTATLTGTGPNLIVAEQMDILFPDSPGIDFATWFFFAAPGMVITLILAWLWLSTLYAGGRSSHQVVPENVPAVAGKREKGDENVIRKAYDELGPITFAEGAVIFHFLLLVLLWFFRELQFVDLGEKQAGWTYFFIPGYVTDATAAIIIAFALFVFPSRPPRFLCCRRKDDVEKPGPVPALLDWGTIHKKFPWDIVLLIGGAFALADGVEKSGLSLWLGQQFSKLAGIQPWIICMIVCIGVAAFTEVASNTAATSIFVPILAQMAEGVCVNPYFLSVAAGIAASFAFMLPVATPPNAIVFAFGGIKVIDMVKTGFFMNLTSLAVLMVMINTLGVPIYDVNNFPTWAVCRNAALQGANSTATATMMTLTTV